MHYRRMSRYGDYNIAGRRSLPDAKPKSSLRDEQGRKLCKRCDRWLPESSFNRNGRTEDGLHRNCRVCARVAEYGMTAIDYEELLASQNGVCGICKKSSSKSLHIDHDHSCCSGVKSCGKCVRGLICQNCNWGIGYFKDDVDTLLNAVSYLRS